MIEVRLVGAGSISGRVRNNAGANVPDAVVAVVDADTVDARGAGLLAMGFEGTACDATGAFFLDGLDPERRYVVVAARFASTSVAGVAVNTATGFGASDVVRAGAADVAVVLIESKSK